MPAPATTSDFFDVCRKSGVVEECKLSAITGHATASPVAAARALIRTGALTKFQAAQLLAGKYKGLKFDRLKILDRIGSGGMGTVFLCEHMGLRKQVAVKVLPPDQAGDEGVRERFFREARAAAALDHPNIVRVHDMNSSGGVHYIVMEYVEGQDLQSVLNKYGPLAHGKACTYIAQAALGLQHAAEKGLVHRDIKPGNLLVDKEGVVKILDMGLAMFHDEDEKDNLTAKYDKGAVLGTADYMAPEQIIASSTVDGRADIYSLGVTLYALLNGKPPFSGSATQKLIGHQSHKATSLTELRREIPKALSAVVDRMMAKNPDERYQTPAEVIEAITPWLEADTIPLDGQLTRKMPGTKLSGRRPPRAKSKLPYIVAAVAISALIFGGLGVWLLTGDDKPDKLIAGQQQSSVAVRQSPSNAPAGPKSQPIGREEARLVYEIDFDKVAAFKARFDNKEQVGLDGAFPTGWAAQSWRDGALGEVGVADHAGKRGVMVRTNRGDGGSAELHTAHNASPYAFVPGRRYLLRTEFANIGSQTGSFEVRFDWQHPPVKTSVPLSPTDGEWQTADLRFTAPAHQTSVTYFTQYMAVAPDYMFVRNVQVFEYVAASAESGSVVYEMDFSKGPHYDGAMANPGGLTMREGTLPDGWNSFVWKRGSAGEIAQEEFDGRKGLAFRTTSGDACAELTTATERPKAHVKAGHIYRVDIVYAAPGNSGGRLDLRLDDLSKPGKDQIYLNPTGSQWKTESLEYTIPADKDRGFFAYVSNYGVGRENTLFVHRVTLTDLSAGLAASFRLNLADTKAFARRYRQDAIIQSQGDGDLPAPWAGRTEKAETLGDVFVEEVGGRMSLGLRNHQGPPSVQLFSRSELVRVKAGKNYLVKLSYQTEANAKGGLHVLVGGQELNHTDFAASVGTWKNMEVTVTAPADGGLSLTFDCQSVGSESSVLIQAVEVREAQ